MSIGSYFDLEAYDDEAFTVATLKNLAELGRLLGVEPLLLLFESHQEEAVGGMTPSELAKAIQDRLDLDGITADSFGDLVGWSVEPILADPNNLGDYDLEALYNICRVLGVDWVSAIPRASSFA